MMTKRITLEWKTILISPVIVAAAAAAAAGGEKQIHSIADR